MSEPMSPSVQPTVREFWDEQSAHFDDEVDHGLGDPAARAAWRAHLQEWLPAPPSRVLDLGCGTGSLSLLAVQDGHRVTGIDLAPTMVEEARRKCSGYPAEFHEGDAGNPAVDGPFDAVMARHLLWTLPEPAQALTRWVSLLRPGGRLVLVEGCWSPVGGSTADASSPYARGAEEHPWSGGVRAETLVEAVDPLVDRVEVVCLSRDSLLWGREVDDERFALIARVA